MATRLPNRTGQEAVYKTGTTNYVDVDSGSDALPEMVKFSTKASDDSWENNDVVPILIKVDADNYKVWTAKWVSADEYLQVITEEESVGTISNNDAVSVTAVPTKLTLEKAANVREPLTAARTYYVRTDGSDSNTGLGNASGTAFLTIQKAVDVVCNTLDLMSYQVTIQVGAGTYTDPVVLYPYVGKLPPLINGDTSTPTNVVLSTGSSTCVSLSYPVTWRILGFKLVTTLDGLFSCNFGVLSFGYMAFGAISEYSLYATRRGIIRAEANYSIVDDCYVHAAAVSGYIEVQSKTVTLTDTPSFSWTFLWGAVGAVCVMEDITFSGSATGQRYYLESNSVVYSSATAALPGDSAGETYTGAQYI